MTKNINVAVTDEEYDFLEAAKNSMSDVGIKTTWKGVLFRAAENELDESYDEWRVDDE